MTNDISDAKAKLRKQLRAARREHVAAQPDAIRGLLFKQPPRPLLDLIPDGAVIGLYHAAADEAPAGAYARAFSEAGHTIALPRFADEQSPMEFALHTDPFGESHLTAGAFGIMEPPTDAESAIPQVLFIPLLGFTDRGERLGQGGGHYDRWLTGHPDTLAIGMAWDCQLAKTLPTQPHDQRLSAIVTPTRLYGPF